MFNALHGLIVWTPLGLPAFLLVITLVVFFHELGHFLVARAFGAKIDIFSIGFGPEIAGFHDRRGTRWRISWIPIGGYVKFAGDADAASTPDRKAAAAPAAERSGMMAFRPVHQRALVAAAGPIANFLLAIVLFTGLFIVSGQNPVPAPIVGQVTQASPAQKAGIRAGDRIVRIDGKPVTAFDQLYGLVGKSGGKPLAIDLMRQGHPLTLAVTPQRLHLADGLGNSDRLMLGVGPATTPYTPVQAIGAACQRTWDIVRLSLTGIGQLIMGRAGLDQLQGPVGIAQITRKVALFGFLPLLNLVAILSVSIGLINLFPIPLLDGGHLLYYACEAVLGRPLGERVQDVGFRLGLVLVLGLMILATWNDIARLNLF
jgi:regulator of sigma E protease